jgi:acyl-CoA thioester hydrolase
MEDFYIEKKIYYHDTDCGGVVYYANYLKYLEEARTEFLLIKGIELPKLAEQDVMFVVGRVEIDYKAPARYQDRIRVSSSVEEIKLSAIRFYQEVSRNGTLLAKATTTLVCVGGDFKPKRLPEEVKERLK